MPEPSIQRSLAERFRELIREGMSPAGAVARLNELHGAFHFHIVQQLPRGDLLFEVGAAGELVVKLDGRKLHAEKILTRPPHGLEVAPVPLEQYRWMTADPRQAERDALEELAIDAPLELKPSPAVSELPSTTPDPVPLEASGRKKGNPGFDVWELLFDYLAEFIRDHRGGVPFKTYKEAARVGEKNFLEPLAKERRKKGEDPKMPAFHTIREKIRDERPGLVRSKAQK